MKLKRVNRSQMGMRWGIMSKNDIIYIIYVRRIFPLCCNHLITTNFPTCTLPLSKSLTENKYIPLAIV